mmetsp:Transcript_1678/g.3395  ORF Transcript_1678/g.3395 Transcript_1678/m.3395 type:complete len:205 (-) Transcript_1678:177-791(-)
MHADASDYIYEGPLSSRSFCGVRLTVQLLRAQCVASALSRGLGLQPDLSSSTNRRNSTLARTLQRRSLHVRSRAESLLTTNPCLPTRPILKHSRQLPCSGRLRSARLHHRISDPCSFCAPAFVQSACCGRQCHPLRCRARRMPPSPLRCAARRITPLHRLVARPPWTRARSAACMHPPQQARRTGGHSTRKSAALCEFAEPRGT